MSERHYIQQIILANLAKMHSATFTELNTEIIPSDQFTFHIKKLIGEQLLEKQDQKYVLTTKGLEAAGRLNISGQSIPQPKVSISLGIFRNNDAEVLIMKRKRAPTSQKYVWIDRKWHFGQSIKEEIDSLLSEETGLSTDAFVFNGATHVIRKDNDIVEIDVVILNFKISNPHGELKVISKDGENMWMNVEDVLKLKDDEKLVGFNERLESFIENKIILQEFIN